MDNLISIVELKYRPSVSDETLLRCILEAYTYYKLLKLDQVKQKLNDENQHVNVNIRMYNFDDVQCTVIPSVAYGFVTGMNLQLC